MDSNKSNVSTNKIMTSFTSNHMKTMKTKIYMADYFITYNNSTDFKCWFGYFRSVNEHYRSNENNRQKLEKRQENKKMIM